MNPETLPPDHRSGHAAIVGHTNVGKSTLLNHFVGEKIAAVSRVAQTTRTRVEGIVTMPAGQVVFIDTPGFHRPEHRMNRKMIETATEAMIGIDLLLWVVDAESPFGPGDRRAAAIIRERRGGAKLFLVLNKVDKVRKPALLPLLGRGVAEFGVDEAVPISARTGENCDRLMSAILAALPLGPRLFPEDALTNQPERVLAAELIREKILERTREEIPHAVAVTIEGWHDGTDNVTRIEAVILVERDGQKAIVIGKGGAMLKEVGTQARLEIEHLIGRRVGLNLFVKVRDHWRDDESLLRSLGLS